MVISLVLCDTTKNLSRAYSEIKWSQTPGVRPTKNIYIDQIQNLIKIGSALA